MSFEKTAMKRSIGYRAAIACSGLRKAIAAALFATIIPTAYAQASGSAAPVDVPIQLATPSGPSAPPVTITLRDAIERARRNDAQTSAAIADAKVAGGDRTIARAGLLPTISATTQFLGTQGNGLTPNGRYVTNDGIQVYRAWGVVHQEISSNTLLATSYRRAAAAEAQAKAKAEIAQRGLVVTVTKNYYALVIAQRKYAGAQQNAEQARHFLGITQESERQRQVAHSDVVKADIQYQQVMQAFEEAQLAVESGRLSLAVLLSPTFDENFSVVDDLDAAAPLPTFAEIQGLAEKQNPDVRVAFEALRQANLDVTAAKGAFFPSLMLDGDYGIEANAFATRSVNKAFPNLGPLPNLGYFVTANLTLPVWNWGALRAKLQQTQIRQQQARVELNQAQRQLLSNLYGSFNEAAVAHVATDRLGQAASMAAESQRLINLRYQAGASTALEVVDAQNTLIQARNAFYDAQARYRVALATVQTLTGNF